VAALASAGVVSLAPIAVLLPLLVVGMAMLAMSMFRSAQDDRQARVVEADVATILAAIDRVAHGVFQPDAPGAGAAPRSHEAGRIACALKAMAQQVQAQVDALQDAAQSDPLTGMAHRAHFQRLVERHLADRPDDTLCGLMVVDVDGFKEINDALGHELGDRLLRCIGERVKIAGRLDEGAQDTGIETRIARLGGDQFVIFLSGLVSQVAARKIANRVLRVLAEPFELSTQVAGVTASIGLAYVPQDAASYSELLRAADAAMTHAKRAGGNCIEQYTPQLDANFHQQLALERDLREALSRGEFELHYQPQYDCRTLRISSAEALIRWRHPVRGLISPAEFIPLAEKSNLICDIGEWVVREAAGMIARLKTLGLPLRISINVSPAQLEQMEFVSLVKSALARCAAPPRLLEIEITESCAMRDCELAADRLRRLADLGVSIAVDDFGTGYSNLASLIRLPVSRLKIDRSLLNDLTSRPEVRTLAQTIISMANGLGFHSVAEGIEDAEQLGLLTSMGCDVVQGFFLSRPIEPRALEQLLAETLYCDALYPKLSAVAC
jgi:diguanylate cyclase (GGDEF)-like protein